MADAVSQPQPAAPERIGRFPILRKLGEGGMGVVYAARDERLGREVALKVMRNPDADRSATERLLREARAAAAVTHPAFCQIFEIGEHVGQPFLVMELLAGESLASRLSAGALPVREAVGIAGELLTALDVLHAQGVIHRDLKPSNVFLTPHGLKLLDFGLARPVAVPDEETNIGLTLPGVLVGSPHYMSPEQARADPADVRSDLFSVGVVLFEMLSGRRPFAGSTVIEVLHAVLTEHPPALAGSPAIVGVDRVIHKALAKNASHRYASARAMADDLRGVAALVDSAEVARAVTVTRLAVLPFRLLRADDEVEFLAYGIADAIVSSLAGFQSLVVRSSLATARYAADPASDVRQIASALDVDLLLTGTLLRAGDRLRVSVELIEAASGKASWSQVAQVTLEDIFQLQDSLAQRIVSALPLTHADRARADLRDVPGDREAYQLYLRANGYALESSTWRLAQGLYEQCLQRDPSFAPAWARLGRIERVLGKYSAQDDAEAARAKAEASLQRALSLNPGLSGAHLYYAQLDTDRGRAEDSMSRLLQRARGGRAEPEILAGLVHACRYCGLLAASLAAHDLAVRLDPSIKTSVLYSYWAAGDFARALEESTSSTDSMDCVVLSSMGRLDDARAAAVREEERFASHGYARAFYGAMRALLEGRTGDCRTGLDTRIRSATTDGEATYFAMRMLAQLGDGAAALDLLDEVIARGFFCVPLFERDAWLDGLRREARFAAAIARAEARHRAAVAIFEAEGGPEVLGIGRTES